MMDLLFEWVDLAWSEFELDRTLMDLLRCILAAGGKADMATMAASLSRLVPCRDPRQRPPAL